MSEERALTEADAAQRLGISSATLRNWRRIHKGPQFRRFGRAVRYLQSDLERFITSATEPKSESARSK